MYKELLKANKQTSRLENEQRSRPSFSQRRYKNGQEAQEKTLQVTEIREVTATSCHLTALRAAVVTLKRRKAAGAAEAVDCNPSQLLVGL